MLSPSRQRPNKLFYRIGEVSRITGLERYVLRYWETEFSQIRPQKSNAGQRLYRQKDLDAVLLIKKLLYEEGYTIAGARKRLNGGGGDLKDAVEMVKKELREILEILQ